MKKLIMLVAAALVLSPAVRAQAPFKIDKNALVKAIERTDKDLENEKRAAKGQTWIDRGNAMYNAAGVLLTVMYPGQPKDDLILRAGKAEPTPKQVGDRTFQVISYPFADVYLIDDVVQFWLEKEDVYPGAADKAYEAFQKAGALDTKLAPKASEGIVKVSDIYRMKANAAYNLDQKVEAAENFWRAYQIQSDPLVNQIDSNSVFNAGYLYIVLEDYPKAIEIFEEAASKNVWEKGNIPYFLSYAYMKTDQMDKAKDILKKGMELFPSSKNIIEGLINYYSLSEGDFSEIKGEIEAALKEDPTNIQLWNGLGQAYLKIGDIDASIDFFTKFVEAFPNEFQANYYLGDMWIEKGNKLLEAAQGTAASMSNTEREAAIEKANDAYRQSWEPLLKAYGMMPNEKAVVQRLAHISYRLIDDPGMLEQNQKFQPIYEAMQND